LNHLRIHTTKIYLVVFWLLIFCGVLNAQQKIVVGPNYHVDSLLTDLGHPKGNRFEFELALAESKIYIGNDATLDPNKPVRKSRKIFVYVPAAYKNGTKARLLVTLDAPSHFEELCNALDNLTISENPDLRIPPFVLISVQNGGDDAKGSQRGLEYDTMSDRFARFINDEVLPAVLNNSSIKLTYPKIALSENPSDRAVMGCSSGGAAAFTLAWFRPDLFRRVISYSGTFVDQQDDDAPEEKAFPLGGAEYHSGTCLIENSERKPIRVFLQVSENDLGANNATNPNRNWMLVNNRMASALNNKGYENRFLYSLASTHCDEKVFKQTLAETLTWIWDD